jgi:hypothetical protein
MVKRQVTNRKYARLDFMACAGMDVVACPAMGRNGHYRQQCGRSLATSNPRTYRNVQCGQLCQCECRMLHAMNVFHGVVLLPRHSPRLLCQSLQFTRKTGKHHIKRSSWRALLVYTVRLVCTLRHCLLMCATGNICSQSSADENCVLTA